MILSQLVKNKDGSRWDGFMPIDNGVIDFISKDMISLDIFGYA